MQNLSDTADTLKTKVVAAGAKAPTVFMYQGKAVSGTLADCGLATATTIKVKKARSRVSSLRLSMLCLCE